MKSLLLFFSGLLLSLSGVCRGNDTLVYDSGRKLTWADFSGRPTAADRAKGAQITVTINLKVRNVSFWTGKTTYDAYAIAFKDKSWVKKEYRDAYSLTHEQLHFDIAHIYAETLELQLNSMKKSGGLKDQVEELLNASTKSMIAYQELYDRETRGGNNVAKQKEWAAKIEADLAIIN
jgi:hypothetical protein